MLGPLLLTALASTIAQQDTSPPLDAAVRRVALFKNGYGYVEREATVPAGARNISLRLPVPTLGTFALHVDPARARVRSAVAGEELVVGELPAADLPQLLRSNVGREVVLTLEDGREARGRLVSAGVEPARAPARYGYGSWYPVAPDPRLRGSDLVVLESAEGTLVVAGTHVRTVQAVGGALEHRASLRRARLDVGLEPASDGSFPLRTTSLERGWTWSPSYTLELLSVGHLRWKGERNRARITGRATVINEVEDLDGATLQLVTGFPNLRYSHVEDPLGLQDTLDAFLSALGQAPQRGAMAATQVTANFVNSARVSGERPADLPAELAGREGGELFLQELTAVTLRRGERGLYTLFEEEVPCELLYRWELDDPTDEQPWRWRDPTREKEPEVEEIWHCARLRNTTARPWTTAPAATTGDGILQGQDVLRYTAAGDRTTVRITRAVNVQGSITEHEIDRDRVQRGGSTHERVTVEGRLTVVSFEREPVRLEIEATRLGEVPDVPEGASVERSVGRLPKLNPRSVVRWDLALQPGEQVELSLVYRVVVP